MNIYQPFLNEILPYLNIDACSVDYTDEYAVCDINFSVEACHKSALARFRAGRFVILSIQTDTGILFNELNKPDTKLLNLRSKSRGIKDISDKDYLFKVVANLEFLHEKLQLLKDSIYFLGFAKSGFLTSFWLGQGFCLDSQNAKAFLANEKEVLKRFARKQGVFYYSALSLLPAFRTSSLWAYWCQAQDTKRDWPRGYTSFAHASYVIMGKILSPNEYQRNNLHNLTLRTEFLSEQLNKL